MTMPDPQAERIARALQEHGARVLIAHGYTPVTWEEQTDETRTMAVETIRSLLDSGEIRAPENRRTGW